jgi:hypothetical protein
VSRTDSKLSPVIDSAAWHGSTVPDGVTLMNWRPQPPMHDFGRRA